jgi:hypothetical protein
MIQRAYERLFAAFYGWSLKVDGNAGDYNVYYAVFSLSVVLMLNFATLAMIVDDVSARPVLSHLITDDSGVWWILGAIAFTAWQFFYFRNGDRYRKVIAANGPTEKDLAQGPHWKLIAYMVLSFVFLFAVAALGLR